MAFLNRYRITGTLTTESPLHVGNGDTTVRGDGRRPEYPWNDKDDKAAEILSISTDVNEAAYIPGSTLKGAIRSWLEAALPAERRPALEPLFGHLTRKKAAFEGEGGKLEFSDARFHTAPDDLQPGRSWDSKRKTCVAASVAIDRDTRTADGSKLFHYEFVPPGVVFQFNVAAQDLGEEDLMLLLFGLEGFNSGPKRNSLGSACGDGWGLVTWQLKGASVLHRADLPKWIEAAAAGNEEEAFNQLTADRLEHLRGSAAKQRTSLPEDPASFTLRLRMEFDSNFLVNDPSRTFKTAEAKKSAEEAGSRIPDHAPLTKSDGEIVLPASSLRGALRAQAERIFRTLGGRVDEIRKAPENRDEVRNLPPIAKLFGCTGWRAPLEVSDFEPVSGGLGEPFTQQFVAIDRFTGGGADEKKFDAQSSYRPTLSGELRLDLQRLLWAEAGPWTIALLALTIRDLIEGDVGLGFGAAKGYGAARSSIEEFRKPRDSKVVCHWVGDDSFKLADIPDLAAGEQPNESCQLVLMEAMGSLIRIIEQQQVRQ